MPGMAAANAATTADRGRRIAARVLAAIGGLLAGVLVLVLLGEALGWAFLRPWLERRGSERLGTPVTIEAPFRLRLIGTPEVSAARLRLGAPTGIEAPFLIDATQPLLRARWRDLLALRHGAPPVLALVQAQSLEAYLLRSTDGRASWRYGPPQPEDAKPTAVPRIEALRIADGLIHVDDAPLQLKAKIQASLEERAGETAPGLALRAEGRFRGEPAEAELHAPSALAFVPGAQQDKASPLRFDLLFGPTRIQFDGAVRDTTGARVFAGALDVRGASLATVGAPFGLTLPATPKFSLAGQLARDGDTWTLDAREALIGSSRLRGRFAFDTRGEVPRLTGELGGSRLALADLAPAVGAAPAAAAASAAARPRARLLPQADFDLPSLTRMEADVRVALDELDLGREALAPLRPVKARIRLDGGRLAVSDIDATAAGGRVTGSTQLDSQAQPAGWAATLRWRDIDLARWLRVARSDDAPAGSYITGRLQGELDLKGRGRSTAAILGSLDGRARARVSDGSLSHFAVEAAGLDLAQALGVRLRGDTHLPLHCGLVVIEAKNGVLTPQAAIFDTRDSTITLQGRVDLKGEQLGLRAVVHPKDASPLSLRSPLRIEGSFVKPEIGIEKAPIAGRLIAGAALAAINPLAALLPFIDLGEDDNPGCAELARRSR